MDLYVLRHGTAVDHGRLRNDSERPLSEEGQERLRRVTESWERLRVSVDGILTLTPRGAGLEELYAEDQVAYFDGLDDATETIRRLAADDDSRIATARRGRERVHRDYDGAAIARFILQLTTRDPAWRDAPWSRHVFGG